MAHHLDAVTRGDRYRAMVRAQARARKARVAWRAVEGEGGAEGESNVYDQACVRVEGGVEGEWAACERAEEDGGVEDDAVNGKQAGARVTGDGPNGVQVGVGAMGGKANGGDAMGGKANGGDAMGGKTNGGDAMGGKATSDNAMGGKARTDDAPSEEPNDYAPSEYANSSDAPSEYANSRELDLTSLGFTSAELAALQDALVEDGGLLNGDLNSDRGGCDVETSGFVDLPLSLLCEVLDHDGVSGKRGGGGLGGEAGFDGGGGGGGGGGGPVGAEALPLRLKHVERHRDHLVRVRVRVGRGRGRGRG